MGTRAALGRPRELAAMGCVGARGTIWRSRRRSSARGWGCCSSGSRRRRLLIVRDCRYYIPVYSQARWPHQRWPSLSRGHTSSLIGTQPSSRDFQMRHVTHSKYIFFCSFTPWGVVISRVVCRMGIRVFKVTSCKLMLVCVIPSCLSQT